VAIGEEAPRTAKVRSACDLFVPNAFSGEGGPELPCRPVQLSSVPSVVEGLFPRWGLAKGSRDGAPDAVMVDPYVSVHRSFSW
jgi:hypothetical protein